MECFKACNQDMGMMKEQIEIEEILNKWKDVRKKIYISVINAEWNKDKLQNIPHKKFLDLAVIPRVELCSIGFARASCDVTYSLLGKWGMNEEELWVIATYQFLRDSEFETRDVHELILEEYKEMTGKELELDEEEDLSGYQFVMKKSKELYGAVGILRSDLLEKFAKEQGGSFFILPCSVHEIILIPDRGNTSLEELQETVKLVNETQVEPRERLSDEVYYYSRETNQVSKLSR